MTFKECGRREEDKQIFENCVAICVVIWLLGGSVGTCANYTRSFSFLCAVLLWKLQVSRWERKGRYWQSGRVVDGRTEQLHYGGINGRLENGLEMRNSFLHARLWADRQGLLRDSSRFLRSGSHEGSMVVEHGVSSYPSTRVFRVLSRTLGLFFSKDFLNWCNKLKGDKYIFSHRKFLGI